MKKDSIIEIQVKYRTSRVVKMAFEIEGHLCQSQFGSGAGGYEEDDDLPGIDF